MQLSSWCQPEHELHPLNWQEEDVRTADAVLGDREEACQIKAAYSKETREPRKPCQSEPAGSQSEIKTSSVQSLDCYSPCQAQLARPSCYISIYSPSGSHIYPSGGATGALGLWGPKCSPMTLSVMHAECCHHNPGLSA